MENQMFAVMVNRCGSGDDNLTFAGLSTLVDPFGDTVIELGRDEAVVHASVDPTRLEASREHYNYLHDARVALGLSPVEQAGGNRAVTIEPRRPRTE
jgi:(R)-amidase